ncbi:MAG: tetratricopeptide repeat protein, partial [Povalibacter sp.]
DRNNPELVRSVTELALRSGDIALAQSHAQELQILAPGDPWIKLTEGWAAISQQRYDKALAASDALLASSPFDPLAKVLKARALIGLKREDDALDLLTKQIEAQPMDVGSLQLLSRIYVRRADWANALAAAKRIEQLTPADTKNRLMVVELAFRAENIAEARNASLRLLKPNAEPQLVASVLDRWADYWASAQRLQDARDLGERASTIEQKLVYGAFLSRNGSPADAIRLAAGAATLPVAANNAEANAVLADALFRLGKLEEAKRRFDAVIAYDPGNATALRGRAELELRTGKASAAVIDAQKLVTVLPNSASDRLLLARCFAAAGDRAWEQRTLWSAFQDIPANQSIYTALLAMKKGESDATGEVQEEFARQRDAQLGRGLL